MKKIERNDRCWCGSGKKYKVCHMDRDQQPKVTLEDKLKSVKREYSEAKYCLHPDVQKGCHGKIASAHTIQRNGGLSEIAENGHVIDFNGSGADILKQGHITASSTGIKDASVFTGFCEWHDKETFKPIETHPFCGSDQQCFLLAYRAVCKELYERRIGTEIIPFLRSMDRGMPRANQTALQTAVDQYERWNVYRRDCTGVHKQTYDTILKTGDCSSVKWYVVNLSGVPDILCSAAYCPRFDFTGKLIQDADTRRIFDIVTCSIIPTDNGGSIVFSWVGESEACHRFVQSLDAHGDEALVQAVVRLLFYSFKTIYGRHSWWNSLDTTTQNMLIRRREMGMGPEHSLHPAAYTDDGVKSVHWKIRSRETNLVGL